LSGKEFSSYAIDINLIRKDAGSFPLAAPVLWADRMVNEDSSKKEEAARQGQPLFDFRNGKRELSCPRISLFSV